MARLCGCGEVRCCLEHVGLDVRPAARFAATAARQENDAEGVARVRISRKCGSVERRHCHSHVARRAQAVTAAAADGRVRSGDSTCCGLLVQAEGSIQVRGCHAARRPQLVGLQ